MSSTSSGADGAGAAVMRKLALPPSSGAAAPGFGCTLTTVAGVVSVSVTTVPVTEPPVTVPSTRIVSSPSPATSSFVSSRVNVPVALDASAAMVMVKSATAL